MHVIEAGWLKRVQACSLHAYQLPAGAFRPHEVGGYWVADEAVEAIEHGRVTTSTVDFSGSRLRNAAPHSEQSG